MNRQLSSAEVAVILKISTRTVQRLARADKIPGAVLLPYRGGVYVFDEPTLMRWLAKREAS